MAELAKLTVTYPKWRLRLCLGVCYALRWVPMPDRWAAATVEALAAWVAKGLVVAPE